ncbi:MAG: hypothetical protein DLM58_22780 [Pseudonocardiales bacterium]|nr:MAG: hypothetical protein DLM58_22780 [Pseudonocardiales bacterium]
MTRGAVRVHFAPGASVAAPPSGVRLGVGRGGPVLIRLFRSGGTRIVLAAGVLPAQLIAIRTAASGAGVHVISVRPQLWQPLLRHGADAHILGPGAPLPPQSGPTLVIDDRPAEVRGAAEVPPWQCRLDVRTHWTPSELGTFAHADVVVLGTVAGALAAQVAAGFDVPRAATSAMAALAPGSFALLRRGRLEYVSLDPTPAEAGVLELAR